MMNARSLMMGLVLAAALACDVPTVPFAFPTAAVRFEPDAIALGDTYAQWWAEVEECAGQAGNLSEVSWYTVPSSGSAVVIDGREYSGAWYSAGNRIVLAENTLHWGAGVRHEMLHALIHDGSHPTQFFRERCADVVNCFGTSCIDN
ncbi:MAG: hypothetical protein ABIX19_13045 [Gemmatimonadaceae bacterium]